MDKEQIGIPKLRFPGFTDAWEQRKLGEVFSILKNNTLSRANLSDEHGAAQDIHYGDILTKFNETLDISTTAVPYIQNEEVIEKTKATLLKNGDIVLADTAEDETAGKCTEIVGLVKQKVFAGLHTIPLRPNQSFSKGFLGFYMNSIAFRDQLKSLMQGIKVLSISKKALKETVISFPHDLREQEKIGQHLSNIDTLIALHQRKLEHLKQQKNGLLQKMFPKNGESVPEVRFPGFTAPWERRRLGEVADSVEYGINAPAKEYDGINKYLRITDIDDTTHEFLQSDLTSPDTDLTLAEKFKLLEGDILFARTGASVGKSYIYSREDGSVYYAGFLIRMRFNQSISPNFIFQNTLTTAYKQYVEVTSQRSGQPGVNAKEYSNYSLYIPSKEEQQKIGLFFQQLDTLIALQQRRIEHLELLKKGLLQQMFV